MIISQVIIITNFISLIVLSSISNGKIKTAKEIFL